MMGNSKHFRGRPNISIIGFMCSGKTTIGRNIARLKDLALLDTDRMITDYAGKSIAGIFNEHGEAYFRELEANMIKSLKDAEASVISCGGGVVLNEENMRLLREISTVVYLYADPEKIYKNSKKSDKRPLLNGGDVKEKIDELLRIRKPLYMKYCHIAVDVSDFDIDEAVSMVLGLL